MNTTNFDGQWTRRVIERLGFGTAQGSSTRGGFAGLAVMAKRLEEGMDAGFTIDGPRGPRYVAKPGPVMLARRSGGRCCLFHIGLERAWTLAKNLGLDADSQAVHARGSGNCAGAGSAGTDADHDGLEQKQQEMQKMLERLRDVAEGWFSLSGSGTRPCQREMEWRVKVAQASACGVPSWTSTKHPQAGPGRRNEMRVSLRSEAKNRS